jgi:hypothetical protein
MAPAKKSSDALAEAAKKPGGVAALLGLLHSNTPEEVGQAAESLQALAVKEPSNKNAAREAGVLPLLVAPLLLLERDTAVAESCVGALQVLVRGNPDNRDAVRDAKGIPPLVRVLISELSSSPPTAPPSELAIEALECLLELSTDWCERE